VSTSFWSKWTPSQKTHLCELIAVLISLSGNQVYHYTLNYLGMHAARMNFAATEPQKLGQHCGIWLKVPLGQAAAKERHIFVSFKPDNLIDPHVILSNPNQD